MKNNKIIKTTSLQNEIQVNLLLFSETDLEKYNVASILSLSRNKDLVSITIKKYDATVDIMIRNKKFGKKEHSRLLDSMKIALSYFRNVRILHNDLHLKNIVYSKEKQLFYIIDFGCSMILPPENTNLYYEYEEDKFVLLWNLVFHHNKMPNDFCTFIKKMKTYSKDKKKLLQKKLQTFGFTSTKINFFYNYIMKVPHSKETTIQELHILQELKMFMHRLFFLDYIFFINPKSSSKKSFEILFS